MILVEPGKICCQFCKRELEAHEQEIYIPPNHLPLVVYAFSKRYLASDYVVKQNPAQAVFNTVLAMIFDKLVELTAMKTSILVIRALQTNIKKELQKVYSMVDSDTFGLAFVSMKMSVVRIAENATFGSKIYVSASLLHHYMRLIESVVTRE